MKLAIRVVDAFTAKAFAGNPAGVCILANSIEEKLMQSIAMEVNVAETAFLEKSDGIYQLRWFTPAVEVDLCGHATLASAHILFTEGHASKGETIRFRTRSGELTAKMLSDGWIQLDFPAIGSTDAEDFPELSDALGIQPVAVSRTHNTVISEMASEQIVQNIRPDIAAILALDTKFVIVTAKSSSGYDFVSRFFAPAVGIDEDPVTGSAHCALGPYWQSRLHKNRFLAYQASARGGVLRVEVNSNRVLLEGQAVTTISGEINL